MPTPTEIELIAAAQNESIDGACADLQSIMGVTDGGVASICFSDIDDDEWRRFEGEERVRRLAAYVRAERAYAD